MPENFKGALIGPEFASALKRTVQKVDGMVAGSGATRIATRFEDYEYVDKVIRVCTFTGGWGVGSTKTLNYKYRSGTVSATNLFCGLSPSGSCDVVIAKEGTQWFLVQVDLTKQPGHSNAGTQVLTIVNGSLRWIGTTACP